MSDNTKPTTNSFPMHHFPSPGRMYGTATVGERGQISIPAEARKELSINSGDRVVVFGNRLNGSLLLMKADLFENFADFFMTKLNKLGEHAQEFFDMLTAEAQIEEPEAAATEPETTTDAASPQP